MGHYSPIKEWLLRWLEPYREERAAHLEEWRIFAQKHNAAGKMPKCAWKGMDEMDEKGYELDPEGKVEMYEFPPGSDSEDPVDADYLRNMYDYSDVKPMKDTKQD